MIEIEWLGQEIVCPLPQRLDGLGYGTERGHHDERGNRRYFAGMAEQGKTVRSRQAQITDHQVWRPFPDLGHSTFSVGHGAGAKTNVAHLLLEKVRQTLVIFND
jgi:hypothetical protein